MKRQTEFVAICALLMSSVAMSIDIMLPSLGEIAEAFELEQENDRQLTVVILFAGLTFGQLIFGPLSDATGRKPMVLLGLTVFSAGSFLSASASSFEMLLAGRALQGFGAAGPRIVTVALIRDRFKGQKMAQIMSLIMGIFIFRAGFGSQRWSSPVVSDAVARPLHFPRFCWYRGGSVACLAARRNSQKAHTIFNRCL